MKTTVNLSVRYLLVFVLIAFSTVNLVSALIHSYNIKSALDIDKLHSSEIKEGLFVAGVMDGFLVRREMGLGLPATGTQGGIIALDGGYDIYTIRTEDGKYVLFRIKDEDKLEELRDVDSFFSGDGIAVEARIVLDSYPLNYEWFKNALEVDSDAEVDELVLGELVLNEVEFDSYAERLRNYAYLTLFSVLLFFMVGGVRGFVVSETDDEAVL